MAHTRCMLYALMRMHTLTRPGTHIHVSTHIPATNSYCFSTVTVLHERATRTMAVFLYMPCHNTGCAHKGQRVGLHAGLFLDGVLHACVCASVGGLW